MKNNVLVKLLADKLRPQSEIKKIVCQRDHVEVRYDFKGRTFILHVSKRDSPHYFGEVEGP